MKKIQLFLLAFLGYQFQMYAQVGIGVSNPNSNAVLELSSSSKGLLLSRVALLATNNPSPLSAHVAGMAVYNTATNTSVAANPVYPGEYYNDGTQWVRKISASETKMIAGGTITDQVPTTSVNIASNSVYSESVLATVANFVLDKPSLVEFSANVSTDFTTNTDDPLTDGAVKMALTYFSFTNAPAGITTNTRFGNNSLSYTNSSSTGTVISGYFYMAPRATLNLPAGTYSVVLRGGGASSTAYKLTFGGGSYDNIQIKATPLK
ncbi:hypothetical protein [Chryseobacterium sp. MMS23-Vi53]|uniref:hypothetical protein n=1 Tax=Chryseobacterium sp. MMS23-Vi53 TaxID=3386644 RepID=UPI0039E97817